MSDRIDDNNGIQDDKLSSEELALLLVDALLRASIVKLDDVSRAKEILSEAIDVRKSMGDY